MTEDRRREEGPFSGKAGFDLDLTVSTADVLVKFKDAGQNGLGKGLVCGANEDVHAGLDELEHGLDDGSLEQGAV